MKEILFQNPEASAAIFEYATTSILLVDEHGYIKLSNPHANRLFGYGPEELIDQRIEVLIPDEHKERHKNLITSYFNYPQDRNLGAGLEVRARKKDGSTFPVEISLGYYNTPEKMAIVFLSDITNRRQTENALYEDEKRLRDIIRSVSDAFMGFSTDWRYLYLNDRALTILGKAREEVLGKTIWEVFPHELGEHFEQEFRRRQQKENSPFTIKTHHKTTWWQIRVSKYDGGMAFFCSDMTEQKNTSDARQQSEQQFSVIFNSSPAAISISDLETGMVKDINHSHTILFGFSKDEAVGKTSIQSGLSKSSRERTKIIQSIQKNGPIRNLETVAFHKNGRLLNILVSADIIQLTGREYLLVTSTDISANKKAMEQLRQSEERFAKAFRTSPVALSISSMMDGRMIEVNNGFLEMFQYSMDEVIGKTAGELNMYPNATERQNTMAQLRKQGFIRNKELVCNTKSYTQIDVIFSMEMLELNNEPCVITTAIDITDKKKAEDKLKSYTDLLEQKVTERTLELTHALEREKEVSDMKSRFVSIASHEFRTPLSTILSSTYLLEQIKDNDAEKNKHFNRIRSAVKNLTFILTEFLSLDKLDQQKVTIENELFDIDTLASEVIDEVRIAYRLALPVDYEHKGPRLLILDKRIVRNVLLNLVSNAAKYSPTDKLIKLRTEVNQEKLIIRVKDEGIGIPVADQKNIFTKFYRASNASHIQGTGLGLSIAKRYIELVDGTIDFKSAQGMGAEFEIVLPI